jgi:hypothetical protein
MIVAAVLGICRLAASVVRVVSKTSFIIPEELRDPPCLVGQVPPYIAWRMFLDSPNMNKIASATKLRDLPLSPDVWQEQYKRVRRIWLAFETEFVTPKDVPMLIPCMYLLLLGTFTFRNCSPKKARRIIFNKPNRDNIVEAIATTPDCPASFAEYVLQSHKDCLMANTLDGHRTPLHVLCRQRAPFVKPGKPQRSLLQIFVSSHPQASFEIDSEGCYPLHYACKSRYIWSGGIKDLVEAAPHVVTEPCSGQIPFVLSALAHSNTRFQSPRQDVEITETLFELLRHDPSVLKRYL